MRYKFINLSDTFSLSDRQFVLKIHVNLNI